MGAQGWLDAGIGTVAVRKGVVPVDAEFTVIELVSGTVFGAGQNACTFRGQVVGAHRYDGAVGEGIEVAVVVI